MSGEKSYQISKYEYLELKYFCLQYPKMQAKIGERNNGELTDDSFKALRNSLLINRALEATTNNDVIREYLRKSVTTDTKFDLLDVPMGRNQFYALRRKFFFILQEIKKGTN